MLRSCSRRRRDASSERGDVTAPIQQEQNVLVALKASTRARKAAGLRDSGGETSSVRKKYLGGAKFSRHFKGEFGSSNLFLPASYPLILLPNFQDRERIEVSGGWLSRRIIYCAKRVYSRVLKRGTCAVFSSLCACGSVLRWCSRCCTSGSGDLFRRSELQPRRVGSDTPSFIGFAWP